MLADPGPGDRLRREDLGDVVVGFANGEIEGDGTNEDQRKEIHEGMLYFVRGISWLGCEISDFIRW